MKTRSKCIKVSILFLFFGFYVKVNAQSVDPAQDPHIESHVKAFLKVLNSGKGKPIEELSPKDARVVSMQSGNGP